MSFLTSFFLLRTHTKKIRRNSPKLLPFFKGRCPQDRGMSYIPVLIASTGSSRDAEIAGTIPEIKPITAETAVPINMFQGDSTNLKSPVN